MWEWIWRWETLWGLLLLLYVPSCIGLIVIVLLQKGKGVGFAGAFGIGPGSDTVFGPRASKSLPVRMTHVMAAVFMTLALVMSLISGRLGKGIAPDKVESVGELSGIDAVLTFDELDDLGSALTDSEAPTPQADETGEQPDVVRTDHAITVDLPAEVLPPTPVEEPAAPKEPSPAEEFGKTPTPPDEQPTAAETPPPEPPSGDAAETHSESP